MEPSTAPKEIKLNVGGQLFSIDKELLINNSDYFKILLSNKWEEKDIDIIKINRSGYLFSKIVELLNGYCNEQPDENIINELNFYQIEYELDNEVKEQKKLKLDYLCNNYFNIYTKFPFLNFYINKKIKNISLLLNLAEETDEDFINSIEICYSNNKKISFFNKSEIDYYILNGEIEIKNKKFKKYYKFNFIDKKNYDEIYQININFEKKIMDFTNPSNYSELDDREYCLYYYSEKFL